VRLSSAFVKESLAAHSWLGIVVGAAMYLVCLTGTLLVFHEELARWEQPGVDEFHDVEPAVVAEAFNNIFADETRVTPHLYAVLPTSAVPRLRLASETDSWFVNRDGTLGPGENNAWSEAMLDLHLYLHLPKSWGMILVSALGAMLVALIVSGFLAHPKIFRDAFRLRLGGNRQLEQTDIHNRLSVWGAPFHLMIAITGAYFGLALLILGAYAHIYADGDEEGVVAAVFGHDPELEQSPGPLRIDVALEQMATIAPGQKPILITVHDAGTTQQYIEVLATVDGRLIYSENYLFDANGQYLDKRGFSDGDTGKQVIYSIYRLHFGRFGGFGVKLLYGVLGLALTVVAATGVNIWLARRKEKSYLDDLWAGVVWGAPIAIGASALLSVVLAAPPIAAFWLPYLASILFCLLRRNDMAAKRWLQLAAASVLIVTALSHSWRFPLSDDLSMPVNMTLVAIGAALILMGHRSHSKDLRVQDV